MTTIEQMQAELLSYFEAEKQESLLFLGVGVAAIGVSIYLLATAHAYRGMSYPLIAVGLIQIAVGGTVFFRTDAQIAALTAQVASEPLAYQAAEQARMKKVSASFELYKVIEIALLAGGIGLTYLFSRNPRLYAVGIGLILQASLMLILDLFAERRADRYVEQIAALLR
jgi:hypothetical protein